jgi:hypothetical protein
MKKKRWIQHKEDLAERNYLACGCGHSVFFVIHEPVKAKRHTPTGKRFRTVAECAWCSAVEVMKYGGRVTAAKRRTP